MHTLFTNKLKNSKSSWGTICIPSIFYFFTVQMTCKYNMIELHSYIHIIVKHFNFNLWNIFIVENETCCKCDSMWSPNFTRCIYFLYIFVITLLAFIINLHNILKLPTYIL